VGGKEGEGRRGRGITKLGSSPVYTGAASGCQRWIILKHGGKRGKSSGRELEKAIKREVNKKTPGEGGRERGNIQSVASSPARKVPESKTQQGKREGMTCEYGRTREKGGGTTQKPGEGRKLLGSGCRPFLLSREGMKKNHNGKKPPNDLRRTQGGGPAGSETREKKEEENPTQGIAT